MSVRIPISADPSAVENAFERIGAAIRRAGQEGKSFADLDLSHPELRDMADEIRGVQRNFDDLRRLTRGRDAAAVRAGGYQDFMSWYNNGARQFLDPAERARHLIRVGNFLLTPQQAPPAPGPAPAPPGGGGGGGGGGTVAPGVPDVPGRTPWTTPGTGGGAGSAAGEAALGGLMATMGGPLKVILGMAGVGKAASMAAQAVRQGEEESAATDVLLRHLRDTTTTFDGLRNAVRDSAEGLQLTYRDANRLSLAWTKLTAQTDAAQATGGMRIAVGMARSYGEDPTAAVHAIGRATYLGEDPTRFALLIGEAVREGGMSGQMQDVMNALLRWTENASRQTVTHSNVEQFAALYASMNATQIPGLRGSNAESLIGQINSSLTHGGSAGMASMALMYNAMGRHGVSDPYELQYLMSGGMFETPHGALGHGDDTTVFQAVRQEVNRLYAGRPQFQRWHAMARMLGINERQAASLDQLRDVDVTRLRGWMVSHHDDPGKLAFTAVNEMAEVMRPDANLEDWRKRLLTRQGPGELSQPEWKALNAAPEAGLRDMILALLLRHGTEQTEGYRVGQSQADMANALTKLGSVMVPALNELREGIGRLGDKVGDLADLLREPHEGMWTEDGTLRRPVQVPWYWPLPAGPGGREAPPWTTTASLPADVAARVTQRSSLTGVSPDWMRAAFTVEGGGYRNVSGAGAFGPGQLMPDTARQLGLATSPTAPGYDWHTNADGRVDYFWQQLQRFHGNYDAAEAAMNAGPNRPGVIYFAATGDPSRLPDETRRHLARIHQIMGTPLGVYPGHGMPATPAPGAHAASGGGGRQDTLVSFAPLEIHISGAGAQHLSAPLRPQGSSWAPQAWGVPGGN